MGGADRMGARKPGTTELSAQLVADVVESAIPRLATTLRPDLLAALETVRTFEESPRAQLVCDQLLENAAVASADHVPLCQDTGTVWVLLEVGEDVNVPGNVFSLVDDAVMRAYADAHLRMSVLADAYADRTNTNTNTPAFCDIAFVPGSGARLSIMLKGGGSDNASKLEMLPPGAGQRGIEELVLSRVREKASSACPPLLIGIGIGSTFDHVGGLAKRALLREVGSRNPDPKTAQLEARLLSLVNATGIGPGALGGKATAFDVHVETAPCHIAALPVAINMGCVATRSATFDLLEA